MAENENGQSVPPPEAGASNGSSPVTGVAAKSRDHFTRGVGSRYDGPHDDSYSPSRSYPRWSVRGRLDSLSRLGGPGLAIVLVVVSFFVAGVVWAAITAAQVVERPAPEASPPSLPAAEETPFFGATAAPVAAGAVGQSAQPLSKAAPRRAARPYGTANTADDLVDDQGRVRPGVVDVSPPHQGVATVPDITPRSNGESLGREASSETDDLAAARLASFERAQRAPLLVSLGDADATENDTTPTRSERGSASTGPALPPLRDASDGIEGAKAAFVSDVAGRGTNEFVPSAKHSAFSRWEVFAGSVLPATLDTSINTDLPGSTIVATIRDDVYDSRYGRWLLIPRTSRLIGSYDSQVRRAQNKVFVVWNRIIWPDGSSMPIGAMAGESTNGEVGLDAHVNEHKGRMLETIIPIAGIATAATVLNPTGGYTYYGQPASVGQAMSASVGNQLSTLASQQIQRQVDIRPTLTVPRGTNLDVMVDRDLVFAGPYREAP